MQPDQYLDAAKKIFSDLSAKEGELRAVGHLSYYAVYHIVLNHYGTSGRQSNESLHALLRRKLRSDIPYKMPKRILEARKVMEALYALRIHADYKIASDFLVDDAERAVEFAERVFS